MSFSKQSRDCGNTGKSEVHCNCSFCKEVDTQIHLMMQEAAAVKKTPTLHHTAGNDNNIQLGARVLVKGKYTGNIRYIGDLDSNFVDSKIYVGVKLDDPVGKHDGIHHGKRFFKCPPRHGVFVPIEQVHVTAIPGTGFGVNRPRKAVPSHNKDQQQQQTNLSNDHVSTVPIIGSYDDQMTSLDSQYFDGYQSSIGELRGIGMNNGHQNNARIFTMNNNNNNSSLFSYVPRPPPRPASAYIGARGHYHNKRDGAIAPNLRNFSPAISVQSSQKLYYYGDGTSSSSNCGGNSSERESSFPFSLISGNESALKLPSPPYNELNTTQWRSQIQSIKTDPKTCKLYLGSPPTPPAGLRECFAKEGKKRLEEKEFCDRSAQNMKSRVSYTSRLLSGLPRQEMLMSSPVSADDKLNDVEQFGFLLKKWGGGEKGWKMASAVQKLKDAKRQGDTEIKWQEKIDELESDVEFSPQVKRIKKIHAELASIRNKRDFLDIRIRRKIFAAARRPQNSILSDSYSQEISVVDYQKKALEEERICLELKEAIKNHKMISHIDASSLSWLKAH